MTNSGTKSSKYTISEVLSIAERVKQKMTTIDLTQPFVFDNIRADAHIEFYLDRLEARLGK